MEIGNKINRKIQTVLILSLRYSNQKRIVETILPKILPILQQIKYYDIYRLSQIREIQLNLAWGLSLFICSLFRILHNPLKPIQKKSTCQNFFHNGTSISTNSIIQNLSTNNDPKRKSYSLLEIHRTMIIHKIHESTLHNFKYNFIANTDPIHRIRPDGRNCLYSRASL